MKIAIFHPKTKEVKGTIEEVTLIDDSVPTFETTDIENCKDWYNTLEEAKKGLRIDLEEIYNGSRGKQRAEDNQYAKSEQTNF